MSNSEIQNVNVNEQLNLNNVDSTGLLKTIYGKVMEYKFHILVIVLLIVVLLVGYKFFTNRFLNQLTGSTQAPPYYSTLDDDSSLMSYQKQKEAKKFNEERAKAVLKQQELKEKTFQMKNKITIEHPELNEDDLHQNDVEGNIHVDYQQSHNNEIESDDIHMELSRVQSNETPNVAQHNLTKSELEEIEKNIKSMNIKL